MSTVTAWLKELHLPNKVLHALLAIGSVVVGYMGHALKVSQENQDVRVKHVIEEVIPGLLGDVAVLKIQVASFSGMQERADKKTDLLVEEMKTLNRAVIRMEAKFDRLN